jgi:hypothetical protein
MLTYSSLQFTGWAEDYLGLPKGSTLIRYSVIDDAKKARKTADNKSPKIYYY